MKLEQRNIEYDERINRYLRGLMGDDERTAFEQEVDGNEELRERLVSTSLLVQGIVEEGMNLEGQYQLDAIKEMSQEEFIQATKGKKKGMTPSLLMRWASGIAAVAIVAFCFYTLRPSATGNGPVIAQSQHVNVSRTAESKRATKPTLASLASEYNKPIAGEPDEFVAIRQKIQNEDSKDMMVVVYDIDKIEAPTSNEGAMGAENAEVIKEKQQMHNDCAHWYKALAYLKKEDKESAIRELNNLKEHGSNEDLVKRATNLLKKLEE